MHLVGYILEYICDARMHERQTRVGYVICLFIMFICVIAIFRQNLIINKTLTVICCHLSSHNEITTDKLSPKQLNPLNAELSPICHLLALLVVHHFLHLSRIRVKSLNLRLLMSYIYIWSTYS